MEGFDDPGLYFANNCPVAEPAENQKNFKRSQIKFKEFIRQFREDNFNYKYR